MFLELDGYNEDLSLAVEANGIQHYKEIPYFHRDKDSFRKQKERDEFKIKQCIKNGIGLVVVPYIIDLNDICGFTAKECEKFGYFFGDNKIKAFDFRKSIKSLGNEI